MLLRPLVFIARNELALSSPSGSFDLRFLSRKTHHSPDPYHHLIDSGGTDPRRLCPTDCSIRASLPSNIPSPLSPPLLSHTYFPNREEGTEKNLLPLFFRSVFSWESKKSFYRYSTNELGTNFSQTFYSCWCFLMMDVDGLDRIANGVLSLRVCDHFFLYPCLLGFYLIG